jgi:predicted DNA-binding transcriptional regulator YafY
MRADRLLSLVLLLRHRGRMTAAELARELEVSPRTVFRDVEALSTAGIPVYAERGSRGGFALLPGFTTDLTGLTHDEALALLTAQSRATPEALGLGPAFAAAVRKIVAAMPDAARRSATHAADRVLVRQGSWLGDPDPDPHLAAVRRAVFADRRVRLRYAARDEPARWRTVDPVGMVEADGRWYLLAVRDGVERTYRLSRVEAVEELDEPVRRGPEEDLEQAWQRRRTAFAAALPSTTVTVRVQADRRSDLAAAALGIEEERPDGSGWLRVEVRFGDPRHAERVLWTLGEEVEVLAPASLRARIAARAAAVAALYARPAGPDADAVRDEAR